jgi:phosphate acetyltransferase
MAGQKLQVLERLDRLARKQLCHIALPEAGLDARILHAAIEVKRRGTAEPVLYAHRDALQQLAAAQGVDVAGLKNIDPADKLLQAAVEYQERRRGREILSEDQARAIAADPICCAALDLAARRVHGLVAGAATTTAAVLRAAIRCVGMRKGIATVSSFFVMLIPEEAPGGARVLLFADCGVVVEPTIEQLADIAISTAAVGGKLFEIEPRIAMLSFSTRGSAQHAMVTKIRETTRLVRERRPDLPCDGELQGDAALDAVVGERKSPGSAVAGRANVLIFPDLDSGNIGYKLVQRIGKADAIGPVLQGLAKPVSDLSRGCSIEDIVDAVTLTAAQANL